MQRSIINQHGYLGGCLIKDIGRILLEYATNIWSSEITIARTKWHWDYESAMPLCLLLALLCFFWGCCMNSHWLKRQRYFVLVMGMGHSGRTIAGGLQVKYIHWFFLPCTAQEEALNEKKAFSHLFGTLQIQRSHALLHQALHKAHLHRYIYCLECSFK